MKKIKATFLHCPHPNICLYVADIGWRLELKNEHSHDNTTEEHTVLYRDPTWYTASTVQPHTWETSPSVSALQEHYSSTVPITAGVCWLVLYFASFGKVMRGKLPLQREKGRNTEGKNIKATGSLLEELLEVSRVEKRQKRKH